MSSNGLAVFTICSNNYMPFAKVLMDSLLTHHPDARLFVCLADERVDWDGLYDGPFETIEARALDIPEFRRFAFAYDIMEFNTAVKPFMFDHLLVARDFERVIYLDPDIMVFSPLDPLLAAFSDGASLLLTPHLHAPAEGSSDPDDLLILRAGTYNLGFLGVSRSDETLRIVRWWMRRLQRQCINAQERGLFVDQKFMNLVPGFAPRSRVMHDQSLNLAYWNLSQALLERRDGGWTVNGRPLGFFHFSGFDPRAPDRLSKHSNLFQAPHDPALESLLSRYGALLVANGYGTIPAALYAYGRFASGTPIAPLVRQMFRERAPDWAGDPFESFEPWLHRASAVGNREKPNLVFTNFQHFLWRHFDNLRLQRDPERLDDLRELTDWYVQHAGREQHLDWRLIEPVSERLGRVSRIGRRPVPPSSADAVDVSVIGYLRTTSGVGMVCRHMLAALSGSDLAVEGLDVDLGVVADRSVDEAAPLLRDHARGRVQIFASINADQLPLVLEHLHPRLSTPAYRISMPHWELERFPDEWLSAFDGIDEIWAATRWVQRMLAGRIDKPVMHMPVCLTMRRPETMLPRDRFGLPDQRFLFYTAFDFLSFVERKNPEAAVRAFRQLRDRCAETSNPGLVIKTMNGAFVPDKHARFLELIADDPDIFPIDGVMSRLDTLSLLANCDAVMSLHRCEGLGLLVAEAMALGLPVIATDYSATAELVTAATGYPVDFRLVPVAPGAYPMAERQRWADADTDHAAWLMQRVMRRPDEAAHKVGAAAAHLERHHGRVAVRERQLRRLAELSIQGSPNRRAA